MAAALSAELRKARALTNKIQQIEPLRDQRNQAFRMLAAKGMTAGRIATEVGMTPAGVQRILHTPAAKR